MKIVALVFAFILLASSSHAHIVGTNVPAAPLTAARVADLPAWKSYLEKSQAQRAADQNFFRAELRAHGLTNSTLPHGTHSSKGIDLKNRAVWYGGAEARRIADNLVSFQTPAGGWSKNTDFTRGLRAPGELFGAENGSLHLGANDFDAAENLRWDYVGTFDNDATITELRFLAKVISADKKNSDLEKSFLRGMDYVFAAQFPNGGWPQVWPLQGGYHDAVTFNDDALLNIIRFVHEVSLGENEFSFVPAEVRQKAGASFQRGLDCVLAAQVMVNGRRTVWPQQCDALTLQPCSARNYEMPALASSESATLTLFLMELPNPGSNIISAVHAAAAWFEKTKIEGKEFKSLGTAGRTLHAAPDAGPLWARYYEIGSDRPIFGDRDKTIHDDVNEISLERRKGYGWFKDTGKRVIQHFAKWERQNPAQ